jgi:exosortase
MSVERSEKLNPLQEFCREFPGVWSSIPHKGLFTILLAIWLGLFEFLGNSTFGYINTHSLFAWTCYAYLSSEDDQHGFFIPFLVLGLFWWKRKEFRFSQAGPWLPGLLLVALALFMHLAGYFSQQTRISLAAFYFGLYALIGLIWGPSALKTSFFPMCLFVFALPLATLAETITFPLRLMATKSTSVIAANVFGINVIHQGTLIFDPSGSFKYEVAAACGGLRSLTAVLALCTIYAFTSFTAFSKRSILVAAGFPLAVIGNITRLLMVIIVSEAFGAKTGTMVHDNIWFSLMPYVPPILGITVIGHFLRGPKDPPPSSGGSLPAGQSENREQKEEDKVETGRFDDGEVLTT